MMVLSSIRHLATLISDAGIFCLETAFDTERARCTCKFSAVMQKIMSLRLHLEIGCPSRKAQN